MEEASERVWWQFFELLAPSRGFVLDLNIPDTVFIGEGFLQRWLFTSRGGQVLRKRKENCTPEQLARSLRAHARQRGNVFKYAALERRGRPPRSRTAVLDEAAALALSEKLKDREDTSLKFPWLVQSYVQPVGDVKYISSFRVPDASDPMSQAVTTFSTRCTYLYGPDSYPMELTEVSPGASFTAAMQAIVMHVRSAHEVEVLDLVVEFVKDRAGRLVLLGPKRMRVVPRHPAPGASLRLEDGGSGSAASRASTPAGRTPRPPSRSTAKRRKPPAGRKAKKAATTPTPAGKPSHRTPSPHRRRLLGKGAREEAAGSERASSAPPPHRPASPRKPLHYTSKPRRKVLSRPLSGDRAAAAAARRMHPLAMRSESPTTRSSVEPGQSLPVVRRACRDEVTVRLSRGLTKHEEELEVLREAVELATRKEDEVERVLGAVQTERISMARRLEIAERTLAAGSKRWSERCDAVETRAESRARAVEAELQRYMSQVESQLATLSATSHGRAERVDTLTISFDSLKLHVDDVLSETLSMNDAFRVEQDSRSAAAHEADLLRQRVSHLERRNAELVKEMEAMAETSAAMREELNIVKDQVRSLGHQKYGGGWDVGLGQYRWVGGRRQSVADTMRNAAAASRPSSAVSRRGSGSSRRGSGARRPSSGAVRRGSAAGGRRSPSPAAATTAVDGHLSPKDKGEGGGSGAAGRAPVISVRSPPPSPAPTPKA
eukprot:PLAT15583.1.p1 GENE.PLAT15583.1~~PLAT15583.1.p1  ORF type:complete len:719 (-),score=260.84 PLAT15583.1:98-2254(-)